MEYNTNNFSRIFDPLSYLQSLPTDRIEYMHIAGHFDEADDLLVDTHGADVIAPVWQLLTQAYDRVGPLPTLLERDFNMPPLPELLGEVSHIKGLQDKWDDTHDKDISHGIQA